MVLPGMLLTARSWNSDVKYVGVSHLIRQSIALPTRQGHKLPTKVRLTINYYLYSGPK